jgi:hypothetical protein
MPRSRGSNSWRTNPPRVRDLQIGSARAGDREAALLRRIPGQAEHARLADPRRTADDDRAPMAGGHRVERVDDDLQLALPLLQPGRHPASLWPSSGKALNFARGPLTGCPAGPKMRRP